MQSNEATYKGLGLESPVRITDQVWPEGTVPLVSIFCITYNHVKYIRDAIEGFLMQETTFPVEIFIHDDASTDGTADIVKEYKVKYPQLIKTVFQKENQYSKTKFAFFFDYLAKQRGEFIALCEGDDYWTCSEKLQTQVDCLRNSPSSSASFHWVQDESSDGKLAPPSSGSNRDWPQFEASARDLLQQNIVTTCSVMLRKSMVPKYSNTYSTLPMGDLPLWIHLAIQNPLICLHERMAVYRMHGQGVWTGRSLFEHYIGSASLFPVIAKDLPNDLKGIAQNCFEKNISLAAICLLKNIESFDYYVTYNKVLETVTSGTNMHACSEYIDLTQVALANTVIGVIADKANKAWEQGDYLLARCYFVELIRSPKVSIVIYFKWLVTFCGKYSLIFKNILSKLKCIKH